MKMDKQVIFEGQTGSGKIVRGFFTKKKIGNLLLPVIESVRESDSGDYIESIEIVNILPRPESEVLDRINKMCIESLSPDLFSKWEEVRTWLDINRNINKINP